MKQPLPALLLLAGLAATTGAQAADGSRWLIGDWNGARTRWLDQGIDLQVNHTSQVATNLHGGFDDDRTARYTDEWTFRGHFDLERLFDWPAAEFRISISKRAGRDLTVDRLTDPRAPTLASSVMSTYGYGDAWRLSQMWYRQQLADGRLELKLGRIPVGDDFGSAGCMYQNLAFCGALPGHGTGIWMNSPISQWAIQGTFHFHQRGFLRAGAFEFNPSLTDEDNGFKLDMDGRIGTMYVVELGWSPELGAARLPGLYRIGAYHNTAPADDVLRDINGEPRVLTGAPALRHGHREGVGLVFQQQLTRTAPGSDRGLSAWTHFTRNDRHTARIDRQWQGGLTWKGPFASRPLDLLGIGYSHVHVNHDAQRATRLANQAGGVDDYDDPRYRPIQHVEHAMELFYQAELTPWLSLRPNLQYLGSPGGVEEVDDAWVLGLTTMLRF